MVQMFLDVILKPEDALLVAVDFLEDLADSPEKDGFRLGLAFGETLFLRTDGPASDIRPAA